MVPWLRGCVSKAPAKQRHSPTKRLARPRHLETETETCLILCAVLRCAVTSPAPPRATFDVPVICIPIPIL
jgi:hypothetical protein